MKLERMEMHKEEVSNGLRLKIILPYGMFLDLDDIESINVETTKGYFGILPHRLDAVAALLPGVLTYRTADGIENYIAVDEGLLVKEGKTVSVSVRNAAGGTDLGKLHLKVQTEFIQLNVQEKQIRQDLARLESGFIRHFRQLQNE